MIAGMAAKREARRRSGVDIPVELRRLWGLTQSSTVGRPASLDVARVVHAAVGIADRKGIAGVTLPAVAKALGCTTMALYRHIGSKDELLVLMQDAAIGAPPAISTPEEGWRDGLRQWAAAERGVYQRRPWLSRLPVSAAPFGSEPDRLDRYRIADSSRHWPRLGREGGSPVARQRPCSKRGGACRRPRARPPRERRGKGGSGTTLRSEPGASGRSRPLSRGGAALCLGPFRSPAAHASRCSVRPRFHLRAGTDPRRRRGRDCPEQISLTRSCSLLTENEERIDPRRSTCRHVNR